jgi:hypothetical protein
LPGARLVSSKKAKPRNQFPEAIRTTDSGDIQPLTEFARSQSVAAPTAVAFVFG